MKDPIGCLTAELWGPPQVIMGKVDGLMKRIMMALKQVLTVGQRAFWEPKTVLVTGAGGVLCLTGVRGGRALRLFRGGRHGEGGPEEQHVGRQRKCHQASTGSNIFHSPIADERLVLREAMVAAVCEMDNEMAKGNIAGRLRGRRPGAGTGIMRILRGEDVEPADKAY
jgi:hypothetical protein